MKKFYSQFSGICAGVLVAVTILTVFAPVCNAASSNDYEEAIAYNEYISSQSEIVGDTSEIFLTAENVTACSDDVTIVNTLGDKNGNIVLTNDTSTVDFSFELPQAGSYNIEIEYYALEGKSTEIVRQININGELPFDEARNITFTRLYKGEESFEVDKDGNQILGDNEEIFTWQKKSVYDSSGFYNSPLSFVFDQGINTISFISINEPMAIATIRLYKYEEPAAYTSPSQKNVGKDSLYIQAETPDYKSEQSIIPLANRTSAAVEPVCLEKNVYNVIGDTNWQYNGQWLSYEFEIKTAGIYKIAFKALQNTTIGSVSFRKVYIDGTVPFKELMSVKIPYSSEWKNYYLGEDEPFAFYFEPGTHTIDFEVTLGEMGEILQAFQSEVNTLNEIYRTLLMVMGATPDVNRDYQFEKILPDTIKEISECAGRIKDLYNSVNSLSDTENSNIQFMNRFYDLLVKISKDTSYIASEFSNFQTYISSMGDFLISAQYQPITLDYITILPYDEEVKEAKTGFLDNLIYNFKLFIYSFLDDYSSETSSEKQESLVVWWASGRDQAQIIRNLTESDFSAKTGINVEVELVAGGALLSAVFAGTGPDIMLSLSSTDAANLAFRGATTDLSQFSDYEEVSKRFAPSAIVPLSYEGNVYALPVTQSFYIMFYRKDILNELQIEVPQTWDDVVTILPILQKKQMNFGISSGNLNTFLMMLYQNNQSIYSDDFTKTNISNKKAIQLFEFFTDLYASYEIPQTIDFLTRFRFGTIPIGIADYTIYNQLTVYAPELKNVWGFSSVPGYEVDGKINNTTVASTTGCIILDSCENKDIAWEYLKWWTSDETQLNYGRRLENVLGTAARYSTANLEAFSRLPWNSSELKVLSEQRDLAVGIPETPGSYYLSRNIDFAFRKVVNNGQNAGESLIAAAKAIDNEIVAKRKELGMTTAEEKQ